AGASLGDRIRNIQIIISFVNALHGAAPLPFFAIILVLTEIRKHYSHIVYVCSIDGNRRIGYDKYTKI
ncbi:MAG: hypothetical protein RR807_09350, partial [Oscillospiraceae bacterium]